MHHVRILRFYRSFSFYCTRDNLGHINLDSSCLQLIASNPAFTVRRAFALTHASSPLTTTPICLCRALKILARGLSQLPTKSVTNVNIASGHLVLPSIAAYSNVTCTFIAIVAFDIVFNGLTFIAGLNSKCSPAKQQPPPQPLILSQRSTSDQL
jgi:hypothetical protein